MAIKVGDSIVSSIKYDGNEVKKVIFDGTKVWAKQYTISLSKPNCAEYAYLALNDDDKVQSADSLSVTAEFQDSAYAFACVLKSTEVDYNIPSAWQVVGTPTSVRTWYRIGGILSVTQNASVSYTQATKIIISSEVYISAKTGITDVYLSKTKTATSGYSSGAMFSTSPSTPIIVWGFAKVSNSTLFTSNIPSSWTHVSTDSTYSYYRVGSCIINKDAASEITISYDALTSKATLPAPSSVTVTSRANSTGTVGYYSASIKNSNSVPVEAYVTWLDGETMAEVWTDTTPLTINANSTNSREVSTTTLAAAGFVVDPEFGVAARVYFTNPNYLQSSEKDSAPVPGPQVSRSPSSVINYGSSNVELMVINQNSYAVTAYVSWYNAATGGYVSSGGNQVISSTTGSNSKTFTGPAISSIPAGGLYAQVWFATAAHSPSVTHISETIMPKVTTLTAPQLVGSITGGTEAWYDTDDINYPYYSDITIKNTNSIPVKLSISKYNSHCDELKDGGGSVNVTINANATYTVRAHYITKYNSATMSFSFHASGYTNSESLVIQLYSASGGQT